VDCCLDRSVYVFRDRLRGFIRSQIGDARNYPGYGFGEFHERFGCAAHGKNDEPAPDQALHNGAP
jgi:hypothetical protein